MTLLDEVDDREATRRINQTVLAMTEAELLAQEVGSRKSEVGGNSDLLSQTSYLKIIDGKTARLFATAAALGNPAYEDYGLHYGRLFQLRDDITDGEATPYTADLIRQEEAALAAIKPALLIQN